MSYHFLFFKYIVYKISISVTTFKKYISHDLYNILRNLNLEENKRETIDY